MRLGIFDDKIIGEGIISDLVKLPPNFVTDRIASMLLDHIWDSEIRTRYGYSIRYLKGGLEATGIRKAVVLGAYEKQYLEILATLVHPGDYVIDVGAHEGYVSLFMAQEVGDNGRVFSIEPNPENLSYLFWNTQLNSSQNITVIEKAVDDKGGIANFYYSPGEGAWGSLIRYPYFTTTKVIPIQVDTLDNLFHQVEYNDRIKLIKIDTEGNELKVLLGAKELILHYHPVIGFEVCQTFWAYHNLSIQALFDFLTDRGYHLFVVNGNKLEHFSWLNERIMNMVAIYS